jgi:Zn ribbon nucleic-acid-binding protein
MPVSDEGWPVTGQTCPQCHDELLQMIAVTDDAVYLRCVTCGCAWHEKDQRNLLKLRVRNKPADPARN